MNSVFRLRKPRATRVGALTLLLAGLPAALAAADWQIQVVDPAGGGKHSNLLFDSGGNAHAVYWNEPLQQVKYAYWDRRLNKWFMMKVGERSSGYCSMALDSHQHPHVAFLDGQLKYAHWDGTNWKTEALQVGAKLIEYYTSIALDSEDHPMITYYEVLSNSSPDYTLRLRSVKFNGQSWEVSTIDRGLGSGKFNSMAIGKDGVPQIAYANVHDETAGLRYARRNGKLWESTMLEGIEHPHFMFSIKMVVDSENIPHITYTDPGTAEVKYGRVRSGKWQIQVADRLAGVGFPDRNGIALDDEGNPYISYYDAGQGSLKVAHLERDKWVAETVDDTFSGFTSAIQVGNGEIVVIYFDTISNSLKCARRPLQPTKGPNEKGSTAQVAPITR
jgi:hypothetical protein